MIRFPTLLSMMMTIALPAGPLVGFLIGSPAFAETHAPAPTAGAVVASTGGTLSYKEAKATCLKEKPELKGKDLRTCVTQKQIAARGAATPTTTAPSSAPAN